jgi:hypothetical protein
MGLPTACTRFSRIPATILERLGPVEVCERSGSAETVLVGLTEGAETGPRETRVAGLGLGVRERDMGRGERGGGGE